MKGELQKPIDKQQEQTGMEMDKQQESKTSHASDTVRTGYQ